MKKQGAIAGVAIGLSVGCLWLASRSHSRPEPTYQGKTVRFWTRQSRHAVEDDSVRVIVQMGAVTVPYLTNQLTLKDGALQKSWLWTWAGLPAAMQARFPQPVKASELRAAAAWDLISFGSAAKD